ncbi:MAG TPA: hypothetical protein VIQ48_12640 [Rhodanobacter sp.]
MFAELATCPMPPRLTRATSAPQRRHYAGSIDLRNSAFPPSCAPLKSWRGEPRNSTSIIHRRARWSLDHRESACGLTAGGVGPQVAITR